jgi:hypothetical protein
MRYRKLDSNGDMTFGLQQSNFYRDVPEAPAQAIATRFRLIMGEWFLDITAGVLYQGGILGKYTKESSDLIIRSTILETEGVNSILTYETQFNPDTRRYSVQGSADTIYGIALFSGVI